MTARLRTSDLIALDPLTLARAQLARDAARMRAAPWLMSRKVLRMAPRAHGFLRGTAPLFYEMLARAPGLGAGFRATGLLCGDAHLENFGAYRPHSPAGKERVAFGVNDFDEAARGPLRFDVLRILSSLLVASGDRAMPQRARWGIASDTLDAYFAVLFAGESALRPVPQSVRALIKRAQRRDRAALLADRTQGRGANRRFQRGERYLEMKPAVRAAALRAMSKFAAVYARQHDIPLSAFDVLDVAFRVAGTGSLGVLRVAVLTRGKGGPAGAWLFEMKEQCAVPAPVVAGAKAQGKGAVRVLEAMRESLPEPPRVAEAVMVQGRSMLLRRLSPQEDKLDLGGVSDPEFSRLGAYLAGHLALCHRRAGIRELGREPGRDVRDALVSSSVLLAQLTRAVHVAYVHLAERE
jgi:uncharacterized protein (DUF2252 family)